MHAARSFLSHASLPALIVSMALGGPAACGSAATDGDASRTGDAAPSADSGATTPDAAPDVAPDGPFATATHNPLPQVMSAGGPTIAHVQLVIITYADDPNRTQIEAFGQWIGGSNWLSTVGADYGVGTGTVLGTVDRMDNAPDAVSSTDIETMIANGITDGSIPSPSNHNYAETLYMVFYPAHTTISLVEPGGAPPSTSCREFGGYHSEVRRGTLRVAYAAIPDCGGGFGGSDFDGETVAASHEYMEAASDPMPLSTPGYVLAPDGSTSWGLIGGEIGDLCELSHSVVTDSGYAVQRIWSNTAAAAGNDPCIPADTTRPYFNVSVDPGDVQYASPGDTLTFTLTGWSAVPVPDWRLSVMPQAGNLMMTTSLDTSTLNNGRTAILHVRVPATAQRGYEAFLLQSAQSSSRNRQVWPVAVIVN